MESSKAQDYEQSVAFLGTWGPFQKRVFFVLLFTAIPAGYNILSVNFLLAIPEHHCHIPTNSNLSQDWIQASIPVQHVAGQPVRSSCSRYELDLVRNLSGLESLELVHNLSELGSSPESLFSGLKQESCKDGWSYSTEYYQSTIVSEFDLVCSDQWKQPLTSLIYFLGGLFGCLVSGQISDRFGRKPVLFGTSIILSIFSGALAFAPSWPVVAILHFMMGMGQLSSYVAVFVLGSEILIGSPRLFFSNLCLPFFYVFAMMLLSGTAYLVGSWRHLSLFLAVPGLACIPLWWMVPESPRWLVSSGRLKEAELLLRLAAQDNRVEAPQVIFSAKVEKETSQKAESVSLLDLLRTTNIRMITLILWLIWFSMAVCYFGVSFNLASLDGSPFLNYFLMSAGELLAYAASLVAVCSLPRRSSYIGLSMVGAIALLLMQFTMSSYPSVTLALVLLGKCGILAATGLLYMFTTELFPTVVRSTALSSCAMFSRVGSSVSPYLLQLAVFQQFLPWVTVGALALLSVVLCVFLPETFRQPLPDTINQMAHTQRFRWPWASPPEDDGKSAKDQTTTLEIICTTRL